MEQSGPSMLVDSNIKRESDLNGASPMVQFDEDIYEDAGDLDFSEASQSVYLTRLPKFLWKAWSQMDEDQEIHLGTIRVEGGMDKPKKVIVFADLNIIFG